MERQRKFYTLTVIILLVGMIASCSPAPIPTQELIEVTKIVEQTVIVTQLVTELVLVTATPEPHTPTPEPTPTSNYAKWTSQQVVDVFKSAGLEAESTTVMTKDDYGMAPMVAVEGTHFYIPSLCSDCGGRIFSFDNPEDQASMKSYYDELAKASALFFSWVFEKDNILVQINGDLEEVKANQYKAVLEAMK
jgi:hypothetical protein